MAYKIISLLLLLTIAGCGIAKKKTTYAKERKITVDAGTETSDSTVPPSSEEFKNEFSAKADLVINTALEYTGVRYRFGGSSRKGMDCSGLLYIAFGEHDISLPRVSYQMAEEGRRIGISEVAKGDLLFFKTSKGGRRINHVGLVVAVDGDEIQFIHSTSSRGVIVSSLREGFWNYAFVKATRIL